MIILRKLLEYNIVAQVALDPSNIGKATNKGIANAVYTYLNLQKIPLTLPIQPSAGVVATAPTPLPGGGTASLTMNIPTASSLEDLLNSKPPATIPFLEPSSHIYMFQSIATWLAPLIATISPTSIPATMTGAGPVFFPTMSFLGLPCWATMNTLGLTGQISTFEDAYEILSNFIYSGLLANFIPPIATTGLAIPSSGPYTGVTVSLWPMLDIPDFPIGIAIGFETILSQLGLDGLDDESIKKKQDEINSENQPDNGDENVCNIKFDGEKFICPSECTDQFFNQVCSSGTTTCADVSGNTLTSASALFVNVEYTDISATSELDIPIPYYPSGNIISADANLINIKIIEPRIIAKRKEIPKGKKLGSYFQFAR